jgi:hypothetical protein
MRKSMPSRKQPIAEILGRIKEDLAEVPSVIEFSAYVEYLGGRTIEEFTKVEIDRLGQKFLPVLERQSESFSSGELLRSYLSYPRLNTGASILGFCAVTPDFVDDVRSLPTEDYWVIWFMIEVLQHTAAIGIPLPASVANASDKSEHRLVAPTGETISYRIITLEADRRTVTAARNAIELLRIERGE